MTYRKVRFEEALESPCFKPQASAAIALNPFRRTRRFLRTSSLFRLLFAAILSLLAFTVFRQNVSRQGEVRDLKARNAVLGNCMSLEPLRTAHECIESIDLKPNNKHRALRMRHANRNWPLHEDGARKWVSSYGTVLDYDRSYDLFTSRNHQDHSYFTKRTLKCNVGFGMSVVWDFEFHTSLLHAYKSGQYGIHPNTPTGAQVAASCPSLSEESSAVMALTINCATEIQRDPWGNPATDADHDTVETCTRMAWSWVKEHITVEGVAPWDGLCNEHHDGAVHCQRNVFQVEGRRP